MSFFISSSGGVTGSILGCNPTGVGSNPARYTKKESYVLF